jgi:murein L,D-transpeptidase YafK
MTPLNMARHRNSPHMAFWRMLKQGYDHFEVGHLEPKVDVCEKRYVFDETMAHSALPSAVRRTGCRDIARRSRQAAP